MKTINPFIVSGYIDPNYFCDRVEETARVLSAIENQRHLTLFSLRRMGKTGLIRHAFYQVAKEKEVSPIYLDIMPTANIAEFASSFGKAVFSAIAQKESALKKLLTGIVSLRPTLSYDSITGNPEVSIKVDNSNDAGQSLEIIFQYLANQRKHFICAIDEFQQISNYPEQNVEAELRKHIQQIQNSTFIFSGSRKHILSEIFSSPNRPFFNSTEIMEIGRIDTNVYNEFITGHFKAAGKTISKDALALIEQYSLMHTFFVQYLCNRLYSENYKTIGVEEVRRKYFSIIEENEPIYSNYINLLTSFQLKLLRAIARNKEKHRITSKEFIQQHNLGASSSISTAIKSLLDKEFIYIEDGRYYLVDRFFSGWLSNI
jgi:hypothetical protein